MRSVVWMQFHFPFLGKSNSYTHDGFTHTYEAQSKTVISRVFQSENAKYAQYSLSHKVYAHL